MNVFDIVGPIMVGPSSSHTAGVVRIGNIVYKMVGHPPASVTIKFYGSFAKTYAGHGSDKAVIGGLLGFKTDDENIINSFALAAEKEMAYTFETGELAFGHPNSIIIEAEADDGQVIRVLGESIGGGNIIIRRINEIEVEFDGQYDTLIINHNDSPGAIAIVTNVLSVEQINIAKMKVYRSRKGGEAIMIIETDGRLSRTISRTLEALPHIKSATVISGLI